MSFLAVEPSSSLEWNDMKWLPFCRDITAAVMKPDVLLRIMSGRYDNKAYLSSVVKRRNGKKTYKATACIRRAKPPQPLTATDTLVHVCFLAGFQIVT